MNVITIYNINPDVFKCKPTVFGASKGRQHKTLEDKLVFLPPTTRENLPILLLSNRLNLLTKKLRLQYSDMTQPEARSRKRQHLSEKLKVYTLEAGLLSGFIWLL